MSSKVMVVWKNCQVWGFFFIFKIICYGKCASLCEMCWNKIGVLSIICNMTQIKVFTRYLEIRKPLIGLRISLPSIIDTFFSLNILSQNIRILMFFLSDFNLIIIRDQTVIFLFMKIWFEQKSTKTVKHQVQRNLPSKPVILFSQPNKFQLSRNRLISSFSNVILLFANLSWYRDIENVIVAVLEYILWFGKK